MLFHVSFFVAGVIVTVIALPFAFWVCEGIRNRD